MLYSILNRQDLQNLNELVSLQNQVKVVRLQDQLVEQNFHQELKKVFETVFNTYKITAEGLTKTMMLTSNFKYNDKALANLNKKLLERLKDRGIRAFFWCLFYLKSLTLKIPPNLHYDKILIQIELIIC